MKDRYEYIAVFYYDDDGISVEFPDLPGCLTCADTTEQAIHRAKEALGLHLWSIENDNEVIPEPSKLENISYDEGGVPCIVDVFMPVIRDKVKTKFTKKTLSLPAWLAAKADEEHVNCSKIFQNALIEYLGLKETI